MGMWPLIDWVNTRSHDNRLESGMMQQVFTAHLA
jgi:hypothetical protein